MYRNLGNVVKLLIICCKTDSVEVAVL